MPANLDDGCEYYEYQVQAAHAGDSRPEAKRRLAAEVNVQPRQVREIYFTDRRYISGAFRRVVRRFFTSSLDLSTRCR